MSKRLALKYEQIRSIIMKHHDARLNILYGYYAAECVKEYRNELLKKLDKLYRKGDKR